MTKAIQAVLLVFLVLFSATAQATHENDHRFMVGGYVLDDSGDPVKDAKVLIVVTRIDEGTTVFTDSRGYYETTLHLHDNNLGDEIVVTTQGISKQGIVDFVPGDKTTKRGLQISFGTPDNKGSGGSGNSMLYGGVGVLAAGLVVYMMTKNKNSQSAKSKKN